MMECTKSVVRLSDPVCIQVFDKQVWRSSDKLCGINREWPVTWSDAVQCPRSVRDNVRLSCKHGCPNQCTGQTEKQSASPVVALASVQSNVELCLQGRPAQLLTGVTACDTHHNLNSSISLPANQSGSTVHRNNFLPLFPSFSALLSHQSNTCFPDILPVLRTTRCSVHDQANCFSCPMQILARSLMHWDAPNRKAPLLCSTASNVASQSSDNRWLLSCPSRPPAPSPPHQFVSQSKSVSTQPLCKSRSQVLCLVSSNLIVMYRVSYTTATSQVTGPCLSSLHSISSDSSSPITSRLCHDVISKSTLSESKDNNNETEDLNSICKYLPTSDRSPVGLCSASSPSVHCVQQEQQQPSRSEPVNVWPGVSQNESTRTRFGECPNMCNTACRSHFTAWLLNAHCLRLLFAVLLFCQWQPQVRCSANIRAIEKRILDSIIGDGQYDSRIRPMGNTTVGRGGGVDGPAVVNVNLLIRSISRIDDVVMVHCQLEGHGPWVITDLQEYSVQVTFREQWVDSRLKFDNMNGQIRYLVLTDPDKVWRPDLFFKNEKEGHFHEIIMPNVLLRIHPEGEVLYSIRISLVLACPMNLKYYPLDKQICSIQMASYGYTTEDLMFIWKTVDPVQINTNLHLPRFTLEKYLTDYCTSKTNTGSYSCLKVDLLFKREFSYYLIQIYIPCCMLVIVSWVSFWLDPNAIPARVSLGVTTLLTMATSISGINSSLPPVSYTKAIDVWTGVCLTFVFGALLEFALVNYASRSDAHRAALKQQQAAFAAQRKWDLEHAAALEADHIDDRSTSAFAMRPLVRQHGDFHGEKMRACEIHVTLPKRNWCKRWLSKFPTRSKRIDVISRIFFPLMFALFNLVYWTTYLFREDMQDL